MDLVTDMQTFVRVVESGSITRAADQLNLAKSVVSKRLKRLEKHLGTALLVRTTRSQKLTESGEVYHARCRQILDDVNDLENQIRSTTTSLAGDIHLAAPLSFGLKHLNPALRQFNQAHPEITLHVDFSDRLVDMVREGYDLAIRISDLKDSSMIARKITHTGVALCASPAYLDRHGVPKHPDDLKEGHVKLKYSRSGSLWNFQKPGGPLHEIQMPSAMVANNGDFMLDAAIDGLGLLLTPDFICYKAIRTGQLIQLMPEYLNHFRINAYAVYPNHRHLSVRVQHLIQFLSAFFGSEPYWQLKTA